MKSAGYYKKLIQKIRKESADDDISQDKAEKYINT